MTDFRTQAEKRMQEKQMPSEHSKQIEVLRKENAELREAVRLQALGLEDLKKILVVRFETLSNEVSTLHQSLNAMGQTHSEMKLNSISDQKARLERILKEAQGDG